MNDDDNDFYFGLLNHVSVDELVYALGITSPVDAYKDRARKMFGYITEQRAKQATQRPPEPDYNAAFELTARELGESLQRLKRMGTVSEILTDIKKHREPAWFTGDVVKDSDGIVWKYQFGSSWVKFGCTSVFRHDVPKRPLTKIGTMP